MQNKEELGGGNSMLTGPISYDLIQSQYRDTVGNVKLFSSGLVIFSFIGSSCAQPENETAATHTLLI